MSYFSGKWSGNISGSMVGYLVLDLSEEAGTLKGIAALKTDTDATFVFDLEGSVERASLEAVLTPRVMPEKTEINSAKLEGQLQADGNLAGEWTIDENSGTFLTVKQAEFASSSAPPRGSFVAATAINYEKRSPIRSCMVDSEMLRRIYKDMNAGSDEAARLDIALRRRMPQASESSIARWLVPRFDFSLAIQPFHRQIRLGISTIILGVAGSLAAAAIWAAFF